MRKLRIAIVVALIVGQAALLSAQSSWEGSAVVARYGEFPPGGLYAASNTFPLNSLVDVTNTATGRSARLIIANRLDDSGVFLLLSETAADELGVARGSSASVRAEPVQLPGLTAVEPNQDLPFHPDPDVNPAASLGDPNTPIINPAAARATQTAPTPSAAPVIAAVEEAPSDAPVAAEEPTESEPEPQIEPESQPELRQEPQTAAAVVEERSEPESDPESTEDEGAAPEPSIAAVIAVEAEDEATTPTEEPDVAQPRLEDLESPDRIADIPVGDAVIGVAPEPPEETPAPVTAVVESSQSLQEPESPSPNVYPVPRAPLVVELSTPPDPQDEEEVVVEIAAPVEAEPLIDEAADAVEPEEAVVDPLDERLGAIERYLAEQRVSSAPLEVDPLDTLQATEPGVPTAPVAELPEVNPAAAFDAEVSDPLPQIPNPVRLSVILPEISDTTAPEIANDLPAEPDERSAEIALPLAPVDDDGVEIGTDAPDAPVLAADEIVLPLVPLREDTVEVSDRLADAEAEDEVDVALAEPSADAERVREDRVATEEPVEESPVSEPEPGREALRPTLIPEDAIISLEPADYRSPEPPQPSAEDLPAESAGQEGEFAPELAEAPAPGEEPAVAIVEPVEERPIVVEEPPSSEERVAERQPSIAAVEERAPDRVVERRPTTAPTDGRAWALENLPLVGALEHDSAYVQVAAFANPRSAKQTIERLGDRYPVAVLSDEGEREFYRVFVGPLNEDEKGSALFQIRSRGFRDAFIRQP